MARLARVVIPGLPHHVTQRGNRAQRVFHEDGDWRYYLKLVSEAAKASGTEIWAYCLMPNHVHFVAAPSTEDGLRQTFATPHKRYTAMINRRNGWTGHLWQGRFNSSVMDEAHLMAAVRYVSLNPVRAGLVARAEDWVWSSARAHLAGRDDGVVTVAPMLSRFADFAGYLSTETDPRAVEALRRAYSTGRPVGAADWVRALEGDTGRRLSVAARGRKPLM
ncbi:MAG: transposase [Caulobacter sp.]|nr:transposase [Caulobacter sp.]